MIDKLVIDELNKKRDEFINLIVNKADIYEPIDTDLLPVVLKRVQGDDETDWIVCQIGAKYSNYDDIPVWKSPKRKYKLIDWGWADNTYGFLLKII